MQKESVRCSKTRKQKQKKQKQNKHSSKLETYINREIIVKLNIKKKNNKGDQRKCSSICKNSVINIKSNNFTYKKLQNNYTPQTFKF